MPESKRLNPKRTMNFLFGVISFCIIVGALFQIHRLWRAYLVRTVQKYTPTTEEGNGSVLDKSTADAPPSPAAPESDNSAPATGETPPANDAPATSDTQTTSDTPASNSN